MRTELEQRAIQVFGVEGLAKKRKNATKIEQKKKEKEVWVFFM
jgi:hypothetical protein